MATVFAILVAGATFALSWVLLVFVLGYFSGRLQLLRLLVFVQPFKTVTAIGVFGASVCLAWLAFWALM